MPSEKIYTQLRAIGLPKWPQMHVWGQTVTVEQAKEIIFRTDRFLRATDKYSGGNNHSWNAWAQAQLGLSDLVAEAGPLDYARNGAISDKLHEAMGHIQTEYVTNDWASCCFMGGPHGWCHPDGTIFFADNVGKWPDAKDLFDEWALLATAFPFLDLTVTFMSGEGCEPESTPVFSLRVVDGAALLIPAQTPPEAWSHVPFSFANAFGGLSHEQGLPPGWVEELGVRSRAAMEKIVPEVLRDLEEALL